MPKERVSGFSFDPNMEQMLQSRRRFLDVAAGRSMPPENSFRGINSSNVSEMNFDINMVIILAALLCALVGALALNSILHYVLRWRRRLSAETTRQQSTADLKRSDLQQIPMAVYGADGSIRSTECAICLAEFEEGDDVRILPKCNHGFHVKCIDTWLVSHSSCPNCRHSLLERTTDTDGGGAVRPPGNESGQLQGDIIILIAAI